MTHVVTLIAGEPAGLDDSTVRRVREALEEQGAECDPIDWLAPGLACDVGFSWIDPDQAQAAVAGILDGLPIDHATQEREGRRKAVLVADMESTIIHQEMLDELGHRIGLGERIAAITARAMNGEIDFRDALRERVGLLAGLDAGVLDDMTSMITLMPGAAALVDTMRGHGAYCALVSGGFKAFTRFVARRLEFDEEQANDLEIVDGKLTGRPVEPILDKTGKLDALHRITAARHVPTSAAITVGDGANDLPMLMEAGIGVAYHAKPSVAAVARTRINHADLTALLYIQGYRQSHIIAD